MKSKYLSTTWKDSEWDLGNFMDMLYPEYKIIYMFKNRSGEYLIILEKND